MSDAERTLQVLDYRSLAKSFLRLDRFVVRFPLYGGGLSPPAPRDNVHRGDSIAALLHMRRGSEHYIVLVEQFRLSTLLDPADGMPDLDMSERPQHLHLRDRRSGPARGRILELMAGAQKAGEPWRDALRRESVEETTYELASTELIGSFFPSPGGCSEQIHLYYARIVPPPSAPWPEPGLEKGVGRGDDGEDIRRCYLPPIAFLQLIERGEMLDAKVLAAAEWMRRPRNWSKFGEAFVAYVTDPNAGAPGMQTAREVGGG